MLNFLKQALIGSEPGPSGGGHGEEERTRIAAGVILLEAAYADHECTEDELNHVIETLRSDFNLSQELAEELLELAHRERSQAVDLFEFTNHINSKFSKGEKKAVLEAVWRIIHIDGLLEKHEDHFARKLTHLLRLTHKDMIDAKLKARKKSE